MTLSIFKVEKNLCILHGQVFVMEINVHKEQNTMPLEGFGCENKYITSAVDSLCNEITQTL